MMTLSLVALAAVILASAVTAVMSESLLLAAVALGVGSAALAFVLARDESRTKSDLSRLPAGLGGLPA